MGLAVKGMLGANMLIKAFLLKISLAVFAFSPAKIVIETS